MKLKGSSSLIVLIVVALVIAGGSYFYIAHQSSSGIVSPVATTTTPSKPIANPKTGTDQANSNVSGQQMSSSDKIPPIPTTSKQTQSVQKAGDTPPQASSLNYSSNTAFKLTDSDLAQIVAVESNAFSVFSSGDISKMRAVIASIPDGVSSSATIDDSTIKSFVAPIISAGASSFLAAVKDPNTVFTLNIITPTIVDVSFTSKAHPEVFSQYFHHENGIWNLTGYSGN
jgi:hypothetical protein